MKTQNTFMEVDRAWRVFVKTSLPPNAPKKQLIEMRKAFVSGFWFCLNEMLLKAGNQSEGLDVAALDLWKKDTDQAMQDICKNSSFQDTFALVKNVTHPM